jgi:hypothetical protein
MSRYERYVLEWFRRRRTEPPTVKSEFLPRLPRFAAFTALSAAVVAFEWWVRDQPLVAMFATGLYLGILLAQLTRYRDVARIWPVWAAVIDFDRVNALLDTDADLPRAAPGEAHPGSTQS